jgi:hypothetical protein
VPNYLAQLHIAERSVMDKSVGHTGWPSPPIRGHRYVLMRHVDMKMSVTDNLEKYDLAFVRLRPLCLEPCDGRFQSLDICPPGPGEKFVFRRDRRADM